jgi:hypothetical protein
VHTADTSLTGWSHFDAATFNAVTPGIGNALINAILATRAPRRQRAHTLELAVDDFNVARVTPDLFAGDL